MSRVVRACGTGDPATPSLLRTLAGRLVRTDGERSRTVRCHTGFPVDRPQSIACRRHARRPTRRNLKEPPSKTFRHETVPRCPCAAVRTPRGYQPHQSPPPARPDHETTARRRDARMARHPDIPTFRAVTTPSRQATMRVDIARHGFPRRVATADAVASTAVPPADTRTDAGLPCPASTEPRGSRRSVRLYSPHSPGHAKLNHLDDTSRHREPPRSRVTVPSSSVAST